MIHNLKSSSGKKYTLDRLARGAHQYNDRDYQFEYIPEPLRGCAHIKTCGNDKMQPETAPCLSFESDTPLVVAVLYPDKQPVLPGWLAAFERPRLNVTRFDSDASNLKGYFSVYCKRFSAGRVELPGNSPLAMLENEDYLRTGGANYCMYTVALLEDERAIPE